MANIKFITTSSFQDLQASPSLLFSLCLPHLLSFLLPCLPPSPSLSLPNPFRQLNFSTSGYHLLSCEVFHHFCSS